MSDTKYCPCCRITKPVDEFHINRGVTCGRAGYCKLCRGKKDAQNRLKRIENGTQDAYLARRKPIEVKAAIKHRERIKTHKLEYWKTNGIKRRAQAMVNNRVHDGLILRQPCEICGKEKAQAHHDDYAQPLAIRWLCSFHHRDWHLKNGPGLNGTLPQEKEA